MQFFKQENGSLKIDFDIKELSEEQIRLIKTANTLLAEVLATTDEGEYFENTAELMRTIANAVKKAEFCKDHKSGIAYADQAIEYAVETLADSLYEGNLTRYDN